MASIATLPNEILSPILKCLPQHSVSALSKTSRLLHHRVQPHLFETPKWCYSLPRPYHNTEAPLLQLLRILLTDPVLVSYVRAIDFDVRNEFLGKRICMWELEASPTDFEPEFELIARADFANQEVWRNAIVKGNSDAFIALVIFLLPNLQSISMGSALQDDTTFVPGMFKHCLSGDSLSGSFPKFENLHHIKTSLKGHNLPAESDNHHPQQLSTIKQHYPNWFTAWTTTWRSNISDLCHPDGIVIIKPEPQDSFYMRAFQTSQHNQAQPPTPRPKHPNPKWLHKRRTSYRFPWDFAARIEKGEKPGTGEGKPDFVYGSVICGPFVEQPRGSPEQMLISSHMCMRRFGAGHFPFLAIANS